MAIGQFQKGLLGYDPMELKMQEQKQWQALYANAGSPYEKMGIALGQIGNAIVGGLWGGESGLDSKASAINAAIEKARAQYDDNTSDYYRAVAQNIPEQYKDSQQVAMEKAAEVKQKEQTTWTEAIKTVRQDPESLSVFQQPLAESLLRKATKKGWNEQDTPVPQTPEEIKAFAKLYDLSNDPDYGRYLALQKIADKEAKKETQQEEKRLLDMDSIRSTIARNKREVNKLEKEDKFDAGDRWNAELAAAQALFKANGIDPTKPLKGINLANTELVNAQKIALREPFAGKPTKPVTDGVGAKPVQPTTNPIALPASSKDAVIGQVYSTAYGPAQWDGKKFNPVAK